MATTDSITQTVFYLSVKAKNRKYMMTGVVVTSSQLERAKKVGLHNGHLKVGVDVFPLTAWI